MDTLFLLLVSLIALLVSLMAAAALSEWLTRPHVPPQAKTPPHPPKPANDNSRLVQAIAVDGPRNSWPARGGKSAQRESGRADLLTDSYPFLQVPSSDAPRTLLR